MSSAGSSQSGSLVPATGSLPVIECPSHPDRKLVLLTATTEKNRGRRFYRCMKGYRTENACDFFIWEDKYYKYLVDNGFLDDAFLDTTAIDRSKQVQASLPTDVMMQGRQDVAELKGTVRLLEKNLADMQGTVRLLEKNVAEMQGTISTLKADKMILCAMAIVLAAVLIVAML
ncbi:hypothetical protein EJB05_52155, partial [Eragrostis curvula]